MTAMTYDVNDSNNLFNQNVLSVVLTKHFECNGMDTIYDRN